MKKLFFLAATISLVAFSSCENYEGKYNDLNKRFGDMETEYNALKQEQGLMKGDYTETIETLNMIEDTLRTITEREGSIRKLLANQNLENGDVKQRDKIMAQINALQAANRRSANNARSLESKLKAIKIENEQLKKLVEDTNAKLTAKEQELAEAKGVIDDLNTAKTSLEAQVLQKSGELEKAYAELKARNEELERTVATLQNKEQYIADNSKGYIVCGTKKELRKAGILKKLNDNLASNYRESVRKLNSSVNFADKTELDCSNGQIEKVMPDRPASSFEISGSKLIIKDPKTFWSVDKVVVMITKN